MKIPLPDIKVAIRKKPGAEKKKSGSGLRHIDWSSTVKYLMDDIVHVKRKLSRSKTNGKYPAEEKRKQKVPVIWIPSLANIMDMVRAISLSYEWRNFLKLKSREGTVHIDRRLSMKEICADHDEYKAWFDKWLRDLSPNDLANMTAEERSPLKRAGWYKAKARELAEEKISKNQSTK